MAQAMRDSGYVNPVTETAAGAAKGSFFGMLAGTVGMGALYAALPGVLSYAAFSAGGVWLIAAWPLALAAGRW